MRKLLIYILFHVSCVVYAQNDSARWTSDFRIELEIEQQAFLNRGAYPKQLQALTSGAIQPRYELTSANNKHQFVFDFFLRGSLHDDQRSHFDVREAYYRLNNGGWSISFGMKKVFWGVTESSHLVDIINQADQVELFDGTEKLGQAMIQFTQSTKFGNIELYYLPVARRRQLAGEEGRFRFPQVIERKDIPFTNSREQWHPSFAARWYNSFNKFDVGLSYFNGVGREPMYLGFIPAQGLDLTYPIISQAGIDLQYSVGSLQLKSEAIYRYNARQEFFASATGFEYTFGNIVNSGIDIGVVSEYLFDGRESLTFSGLDNDLFFGSRITFNDIGDTNLLIGTIQDLSRSTSLIRFEGSRRFKGDWKVSLFGILLNEVSQEEILFNFKEDDLIQLRLSKFF